MRSQLLWLASAASLLGLGAIVMASGDGSAKSSRDRERIKFPERATTAETTKMQERRTLLPQAPVAATDAVHVTPHDPLLVALATPARAAMVFEAATIFQAPIGQRVLGCISERERANVDRLLASQNKSFLELAHRFAVSEGETDNELVAVIDGNFSTVDWKKAFEGAATHPYGNNHAVYHLDDGHHAHDAALWEDHLLLIGSELGVEHALDRLDAGGTSAPLAIAENEAYGEVYGVLGPEHLARMLPQDLKERAGTSISHAVVHVDAVEDVLLVADIEASDEKQSEDLGKSLGAAMAVARFQANSDGRDDLVKLLDASRIRPSGKYLRAELAVPADVLEQHFATCRDRKEHHLAPANRDHARA